MGDGVSHASLHKIRIYSNLMHPDFQTLVPDVLRIAMGEKRPAQEVFELEDVGPLAVILCHFNPCGYESPATNLEIVLKWLLAEEIPTYAVEVQSGRSLGRAPVLPVGHRKVLQLQSASPMFLKDNLWNVAEALLPAQFQYVLCIDADTILQGHDWKQQLVKALGQFPAVQPFSKGIWTESKRVPFKEKMSCGFAVQHKLADPQISKNFHSGFAIAVRREFWQKTGGFFNSPIGGGSLFLISALLGLPNELEARLKGVSVEFLDSYYLWAKSVLQWSSGSLGFINAHAYHLWHGSRAKRRYADRFERLRGFDPSTDIVAGAFGLHEWSEKALASKSAMVASVAEYFFERDEDEVFSCNNAQKEDSL